MPKSQYAWLVATAMMKRRATDFEENDQEPYRPNPLEVERIEGMAGRVRPGERRAANDPVALLMALLLIHAWNCAKYRAKSVNCAPDLRELTPADFSGLLLLQAAWILSSARFVVALEQCHSDHLPTHRSTWSRR